MYIIYKIPISDSKYQVSVVTALLIGIHIQNESCLGQQNLIS